MPGQPAWDDGARRYETLLRLSEGGMGTVYVGTVRGALGFRQLVAIKKPHPHLLVDRSFRAAFVKEARLASLIHHANVVDVRDVVMTDEDVCLVMDYVEGASLAELIKVSSRSIRALPVGVAIRIALDACAGLHAAHELTDERGRPLNLVHRDISPHNLLVGLDGVTRVADFGVAKFNRTTGSKTSASLVRGKLAYAAPECLRGEALDRRADVFAMGVVLWEVLAGERLFRGANEAETMRRIMQYRPPPISAVVPAVGSALDAVLDTALAKSRDARFENVLAMASALESSARSASLVAGYQEVVDLVRAAVGHVIEERRSAIRLRLADEPSVASGRIDPETAARPPGATPSTTVPERGPQPSSPNPHEQTSRTMTVRPAAAASEQPPTTTLRVESPLPAKVEPDARVGGAGRTSRLFAAGLLAVLCAAGVATAIVLRRAAHGNSPSSAPADATPTHSAP